MPRFGYIDWVAGKTTVLDVPGDWILADVRDFVEDSLIMESLISIKPDGKDYVVKFS